MADMKFTITLRMDTDAFERALYTAAIALLDEMIEEFGEWDEEGRHAREVRQEYYDAIAALDLISAPQENR